MKIPSYNSGTSIAVSIPLLIGGVPISAQSVEYRIIDADEIELLARVALSGFVPGVDVADIVIDSAINGIISGTETREIRIVELYVNDGTGEVKIDYCYVIEKDSVLVEGVNSFQSYAKSLLTSMTLQKTPGWDDSEKADRINALIAARRAIGAIPLRFIACDAESMLAHSDITLLSKDQYLTLPKELKDALCRAQVYQADYLLSNDDQEDMQDSGITSITIGESKQTMSAAIKHKGLVNKRAAIELSKWVITRIRTSR